MRILFVNEKCGYFGGVEQNVASTAQGLRRLGHECHLAFGARTETDFDGYQRLFDGVFLCRELSKISDREGSLALKEIVNTVSPDVIYLHKVAGIEPFEPFRNEIPIVRMVHDHDLCCPKRHKYFFHNGRVCNRKSGWRCYVDMAFLARGASKAFPLKYVSIAGHIREMRKNYSLDRLLVGSRFMRNELIQNGFPESKVHILPPVVPREAREISPMPPGPVILCVAQLIRGKGVDLLLRALQLVSVNFHAIVVGAGNAEPYLRALCHDLKLDEKAHFEGWVANKDLGKYYDAARVVAVPCRWPEPFGMIGLEAMNNGKPVVAFDVGGIPDWLENEVTGLLVPEQDVVGFAKALERILADRGLADRLGAAGLERARRLFSFELYLERLVEHLKVRAEDL